jgi:nitroreductase
VGFVDDSLGIGSLRPGTAAPVTPGAPSDPAGPPSGSVVDIMLTRRSISRLVEPGPTDAELATLLHAATTVPDHGGLRPWRFAVVRGAGRGQFGDALAAAATEAGAADSSVRDKAFAAPALIAVIAAPQTDNKIPEWEQLTSASSSGYAITLAAHAIGLGASWRSTEHMDGAALRALLGMAASDRLLGWVNLGRPVEDAPPTRRDVHDLDAIVTRLG